MELAEKIVLLTGGSAGIGREMAWQLKAKGAVVVVTGRNEQRLAAMRKDGFVAVAADLSHAAGVDALLDVWGDRELDILINNAGQGVDHDFREHTPDPDAADDCIYANLNAPIRLITALLPRLHKRPEAAIINVTSGLAIAPNAGSPVYCATKAALRSYTQALRAQVGGVNFNIIEALPPVVDTQMTAGRKNKKMPADECARQILSALENDKPEANVGMVKVLKRIHSVSPAAARKFMLRF
ncbi:SDR family NAD(P)-dependent oxidoreductase [Pontixanthobacter aestiaquae]|uniref:SDR family NAD(P)-dependent oxidoreductase n=1 Tax=Pontixanthobacter aestiaquae TaxID=1509367 RepID=A0A844Z619_9SPHN|nr:SDR family NAD(P)-dependent oxidoreductase [Pontixanthobacter aestiaquae]MDN3645638.1 SDR family NAD(P)-dependent oxidoreductase [Pontixanthobacter aestiaquae]MXO83365.1 SDR family NAD(P)-dependent oxidoreductase [Pontixanthobacter aestiaquae]